MCVTPWQPSHAAPVGTQTTPPLYGGGAGAVTHGGKTIPQLPFPYVLENCPQPIARTARISTMDSGSPMGLVRAQETVLNTMPAIAKTPHAIRPNRLLISLPFMIKDPAKQRRFFEPKYLFANGTGWTCVWVWLASRRLTRPTKNSFPQRFWRNSLCSTRIES